MKNVNKQPVLKLSLCVLLMGLINVSATNSAFAVQNLKQDFLRAVRAKMESTRNPGLSSQYFSVGDPDKLLAGIDQYVSGVAVDKDYLAHFKMAKYLQSFFWVQHPGLGLTQPRYEDAGWGDIASTPQEKRYSGWIILANPPDSLGGTTAFHEAIHAYHFHIHSNADNDDYGAPEAISNDYARLVKSLGVNDTRLEGILEKIRTGKHYEADLESLRQRVKTLREKHEDYVSKQSRLKFAEVLSNIGGRADWDGYDRAVNRAIADAEAGAPQSLTGLRGQLEALKRRLAVVEGAIPGFQRLKAKYDEEELTMKLHIAAIQKAINEVPEAKEIVSSLVSIKNSISNNLGEVKKLTAGVDEKTAGLNLTYSAYAVAAMEASGAADEICDYASRAASQPPPTADEIVGWISESSVLITNAAISLGDSDKEITAQIKSLDTSISSLRTILKRLEELSSSRETILAGFDRLKEIKGTLDDAEKDVKRAEEIQAILKTALSGLIQMRDAIGQDITDLRGEANVLAQAVRGRDLQLEADVVQLQARIKAAQNAVVIYLPSLIPEVPELSPDFQEFVAKFKDPTRKRPEFEEKFGLVNSAITDGQRAISGAEGAVVSGAFATRNAPANLERARQCYASLKGEPQGEETVAQGPLDGYRSQLKDLEARMDKIEGGIPDFEREKAEYKAKWAEEEITMTLHLAAAQKAWKKVSETNEINEIIVRIAFTGDYIVEKLEEAEQATGRVQQKTADLNLIYSAYAVAAMEVSGVADKVCDYASRAASQPSPTVDEIAGWISESDGLISNAVTSVLNAEKEVNKQIELLEADIPAFKSTLASLEELSSRRGAILADFDRLEQIKRNLDEIEKDIKRAAEIKANYLDTYVSEMKRIQGGRVKDVKSLGVDADVLAQAVRGKDRQLEAGVAQLQARIEAAANIVRMDMPQRPPEVPELPPEFYALRNRLEGVVAKRAGYEKGFGLVDSAIAAALKAISAAEGAVVAGAFATRNAPANIQRARQCYASLKEAKEAASKIDENLYADVEAALQSCDFEGARTLIDQLPAGPKKITFEQEYQAAVDLEDRLKALVEKASGEYKSRKYGDALSTLDKALLEAKCDRHLESINKKIAIVNAAVLKVYNNAKAALNSCNFEKAKTFIDLIPAGPKRTELDQKYQASISLENRLKALVGKANGEYGSRNYAAALSTLGGALGEAKCDRHRESINKKIALVKSKMGPAPEERVATPGGVGAFGSAEEITDPELIKELMGATEITPRSGPGPGDRREPPQPIDDEETITVNWEILKVDKYCSFSALYGKDLRESDEYWALFEKPKSKDEIFLTVGLEANRYFEYLIVQFAKEDRDKSQRRDDLPPHEGYAQAYRRMEHKHSSNSIRVVAVAETRAEIERLRNQQWSTRDREIVEQSEKRVENLFKRIAEKMVSEGGLKGSDGSDRDYTKGSWYDTGMTYVNPKVAERFYQDIITGKLRINLLENGVVVDTVKLE